MRTSIAIAGCILAVALTVRGSAGPWGPIAAALPAQAGGTDPAAEPLTPVPGTKVSLVRPQGFEVARNFPGFMREESRASIMVTEIPAPFAEATGGFTKEGLASRGMNLLSREDVNRNGTPGILLHLTQVANNITFVKWLAAFGDEKATVLVTATFPKELEADLSRPLRDAVLSARLDQSRAVDPFADLNFSLEPPPVLKFARRIGNMLLYTQDGTIPLKSPADPLFVAGYAVSNVRVADPKPFSEQRIAQTATVADVAIEANDAVTVDGLGGREIVAAATHKETGQPLVVYQVTLFEGDTYFIMQGVVGAAGRERHLPGFQQMARSFRRPGKSSR